MQAYRRKAGRKRGHSLLELVGATTIIAIALVPALRLMRESLRAGRRLETSNLLTTLSASVLEEQLMLTAGTWDPSTVSGTFAADGFPQIRFRVERSHDAADGGIPNSLMSITSTVWDDLDTDGVWDAGEPRASFSSKLARIVAYEHEASGT